MSCVQDLGRPGFGASGVPRGGAADALSLRIGNRLVGHVGLEDEPAGIEMTLTGGVFAFDGPAVICLAGAAVPGAVLERDGTRVPLAGWSPVVVDAGTVLRVGPVGERGDAGGSDRGCRVYLCIAGGIATERVMGSRSVHAASGIGGSPLRAGDVLPVGGYEPGLRVSPIGEVERLLFHQWLGRRTLRVVPGARADLFTDAARSAFAERVWRVDPKSDRTGVRLDADGLEPCGVTLEKSEGVVPGAVQVTPSGGAIVLGVDGPTVGGYPVIASVIGADLPALGQLGPGENVRFEWIEPEAAVAALRDMDLFVRVFRDHDEEQSLEGKRVHLGCDTGEADDEPGRAQELALLPHVSAVSVACGGHAGDAESMRRVVSAAVEHGCVIGAHPSYPDREGFGRRAMEMETGALLDSVASQIGALQSVCDEVGATIAFVKPHGALYHALSENESLAMAFAEQVRAMLPDAVLVGAWGSPALGVWEAMGIPAWAEGFVDRAYGGDGRLLPRSEPGAVITDADRAAEAATLLAWDVDLLCVHGDSPGAVGMAAAVRGALEDCRVVVSG